ncbi:MAG TPA: ABC transporter ATP-binding protein [Verrucomicrobiae bacterium]|jgi:ABC-2 type transport system ATP-binding protein|nr:ABC transporter ATP-binding protein [Verrucomicrobiae bacterium]
MSANAIEFHGLIKTYPTFQLGPLDLTVPRGAIYGLIGPNGAGKTTAIDMIFGMGRNDAGTINVLGLDHIRDEVALKRRAAYVSPELNFRLWGRVGKAIRFVRGFYPDWDDVYCGKLMKAFHLGDDERISTLSFGAKTKLSLLLALSRRPEILILDEPTTGLDAISKQQVFSELLQAVEGGERTVLISSHNLSDIERFADHIGMIKNGKLLLEGRTDEIVDRFRFAEFFTENGTVISSRDGLVILRRDEKRWHALVDQRSETEEWLRGHGAKEISLTRVTLEDLFVALAKPEEAI